MNTETIRELADATIVGAQVLLAISGFALVVGVIVAKFGPLFLAPIRALIVLTLSLSALQIVAAVTSILVFLMASLAVGFLVRRVTVNKEKSGQ